MRRWFLCLSRTRKRCADWGSLLSFRLVRLPYGQYRQLRPRRTRSRRLRFPCYSFQLGAYTYQPQQPQTNKGQRRGKPRYASRWNSIAITSSRRREGRVRQPISERKGECYIIKRLRRHLAPYHMRSRRKNGAGRATRTCYPSATQP